MLTEALRQVLCPLSDLRALLQALASGKVSVEEQPRARRSQLAALSAFLASWIQG